jgi:Na+/melibiose symporter-like transporter
MTLKNAAFFALIGMALLTVLLAVGFIRDVSALLAGAVAAITVLIEFINLLASLSVAVFLYVFYKAQSRTHRALAGDRAAAEHLLVGRAGSA